jgi:hypothetical protein
MGRVGGGCWAVCKAKGDVRWLGVSGWACLFDPRYHVVLAVKVCAPVCGGSLRPAAVFEP